jgi:cell division protein FtsQ
MSYKQKNKKILAISILLGISFFLLCLSPVFNISKIKVVGASHYNDKEIIKISGIFEGVNGFKNIGGNIRNFLSLRYGQAETSIINKCSYIKDVEVRYNFLNKVTIHIKERSPYMLVPYIGAYLIVDRYGYVLETIGEKDKHIIPFVKGLKFIGYEIGQTLEIENQDSFKKLIVLLDALTEEEKNDNFKLEDNVSVIDISDIENVHLLIDSRIIVNLGDLYDLDYRIRALKQIININIGKEEKGILDFTISEYPIFKPDK